MGFAMGSNNYSIAFGSTPENVQIPHYDVRAPTTADNQYPVGKRWIWPQNGEWVSNGNSSAGGTLTTTWLQLANATGDLLISAPLTVEGVLYATAANTTTSTAAGTSGQLLQSAGAGSPPAYTTTTYPATNAINTLLYASAANTMSALATANNGTLITSGAGVPSISSTLPAAVQGNITSVGALASGSLTTGFTAVAVAQGGTGLTSATPVAILTTTTASAPAWVGLNDGQTVVGQGPSSNPIGTYFSNNRVTYVPKFSQIPVMSALTGGVAAVTVNTTNAWAYTQWGAYFEQYNTVATSIIAPTLSATLGSGLNIGSLTGANAKIIEITEGNSVNSKFGFVTGTSGAFYIQAAFIIPTLNTVQNLAIGFRKVQAYQGTSLPTYTDYALIGVLGTAGEFEIQTQVGSGGEVDTDTTQAATAATLFTLRVNVSSAGVVTYQINGAPPTVTAAYTFTASTSVIPMIYLAEAAGAHGECDLVSYQCGFA